MKLLLATFSLFLCACVSQFLCACAPHAVMVPVLLTSSFGVPATVASNNFIGSNGYNGDVLPYLSDSSLQNFLNQSNAQRNWAIETGSQGGVIQPYGDVILP